MKHQAKRLITGEWAVFSGRKYFINTVTKSKEYAKQQALIRSIKWYINQAHEAWAQLEDIAEKDDRMYDYGIFLYDENGKVTKTEGSQIYIEDLY